MSRTRTIRRRDVLKGTLTAATALGTPWVAPASALGLGPLAAPSERIGLAFIGPGGRGRQLVTEMAGRPEVEPLAVCDVHRGVREKVRAMIEDLTAPQRSRAGYRACQPCRDFRDVLARPDIDAVVLSGPEHTRPTICILAARAGKDIYAEKPFALRIREAQAMVAAIRRYGRIFQHGTQRRSNNEWKLRDSCELVRNGRIGRVTHAVVTVGPPPRDDSSEVRGPSAAPDPEQFDWELWLGPAPWRPCPGGNGLSGWQGRRDFGLGAIGNWGSHVLDMAQWALGKDEEGPVEILPPQGEKPMSLKYSDGKTIYCPRTKGDSAETAVYGTEGAKSIFGGPKIQEKYDRRPLGPDELQLYRPKNDDHVGNWLECIRTRKKTICNEEVAYRSGSLCMLIHIMDQLNRPLKYDPVRGEFPGDDEANRLLDTAKRPPWQVY